MSAATVPNPHAFPAVLSHGGQQHVPGMTLLDYFAGQALEGYLSRSQEELPGDRKVAEWSYKIGLAMLQARQEVK